ncbi:IS3 family transposase, partial [Salmonella enterica]|nr:IS3 family transposase [Salmonella enterica]
FSSLKKEHIRKRIYKTRARRHSHLGSVSPEAFEQASS